MTPPWGPGTGTGIGSLPGVDQRAAQRLVLDELPMPHLPELPARGPGADLTGRGLAHLDGFGFDLQPAGWRLVDRPGVDARRARDLLAGDRDVMHELAGEWAGPFKIQIAGPWTLAATVSLPRGEAVLSDRGALRDLVQALTEAAQAATVDASNRLPGARIVVQLDEPALPAVLAGSVPTASGLHALRRPEPAEVAAALEAVLRAVSAAGGTPVVHCCADDPPLALLAGAGAAAVAVDPRRRLHENAIGEQVEAGLGLLLGLVPALGPGAPPSVRELVEPARQLWSRLGLPPERLATEVAVTPACGLAGASPGWARTALRLTRQAAAALADSPERSQSAAGG